MLLARVMYHVDGLEKIERLPQGDWTDLRAAEDVELKAGDFALIDLGVSIEMPAGYEAILAPRSSTFMRYGVLMANSFGVIDNSFNSSQDVWKMPVYATRDTVIHKNDRICQFRMQKISPDAFFKTVDNLDHNLPRGGFGSTGVD